MKAEQSCQRRALQYGGIDSRQKRDCSVEHQPDATQWLPLADAFYRFVRTGIPLLVDRITLQTKDQDMLTFDLISQTSERCEISSKFGNFFAFEFKDTYHNLNEHHLYQLDLLLGSMPPDSASMFTILLKFFDLGQGNAHIISEDKMTARSVTNDWSRRLSDSAKPWPQQCSRI